MRKKGKDSDEEDSCSLGTKYARDHARELAARDTPDDEVTSRHNDKPSRGQNQKLFSNHCEASTSFSLSKKNFRKVEKGLFIDVNKEGDKLFRGRNQKIVSDNCEASTSYPLLKKHFNAHSSGNILGKDEKGLGINIKDDDEPFRSQNQKLVSDNCEASTSYFLPKKHFNAHSFENNLRKRRRNDVKDDDDDDFEEENETRNNKLSLEKKKRNTSTRKKKNTIAPIIIIAGPFPPPDMPESLRQRLQNKGVVLSTTRLLLQKMLKDSDVKQNQNRISLPINRIGPDNFLTEGEKERLLHKGMEVEFIGPGLEETRMRLTIWHYKSSSSYVLNKNWYRVAKSNNLKDGNIVQIWFFRRNSPCFAVVRLS